MGCLLVYFAVGLTLCGLGWGWVLLVDCVVLACFVSLGLVLVMLICYVMLYVYVLPSHLTLMFAIITLILYGWVGLIWWFSVLGLFVCGTFWWVGFVSLWVAYVGVGLLLVVLR